MWSARRPPARVSGPAARTNDIDTDERRQIIPQRGRPTTNHQQGVDKRCLIPQPPAGTRVIGCPHEGISPWDWQDRWDPAYLS
jgi:hypothetical protein